MGGKESAAASTLGKKGAAVTNKLHKAKLSEWGRKGGKKSQKVQKANKSKS